jgi:uncharacterized protein YlxW (UPF0749 family)
VASLSGRLNRLEIAIHERRIRSMTAEINGRLTLDEVRRSYYKSVRVLAQHPELYDALPGEGHNAYLERIVRCLAAEHGLDAEETERAVAYTRTIEERVQW